MARLTQRTSLLPPIFVLCILILAATNVSAAYNDFVSATLRSDLPVVYNAKDYTVYLMATQAPPSIVDEFTCAWLSVNLDNQPGTYGLKFTQVGLMTEMGEMFWFAYSEAGIDCNEVYGTTRWGGLGCAGYISPWFSLNRSHKVELVTYGQGQWIVRVYDIDGQGHDVATIPYAGTRIYQATATMEEGYTHLPDPYWSAHFYFSHPKYMVWGTGFQDWPISTGPNEQRSAIGVVPSHICPNYYGSIPNMWGDPRIWYAGTGGYVCSVDPLFPTTDRCYLPLVLRQYQ